MKFPASTYTCQSDYCKCMLSSQFHTTLCKSGWRNWLNHTNTSGGWTTSQYINDSYQSCRVSECLTSNAYMFLQGISLLEHIRLQHLTSCHRQAELNMPHTSLKDLDIIKHLPLLTLTPVPTQSNKIPSCKMKCADSTSQAEGLNVEIRSTSLKSED